MALFLYAVKQMPTKAELDTPSKGCLFYFPKADSLIYFNSATRIHRRLCGPEDLAVFQEERD